MSVHRSFTGTVVRSVGDSDKPMMKTDTGDPSSGVFDEGFGPSWLTSTREERRSEINAWCDASLEIVGIVMVVSGHRTTAV